MYIYEHMHTYSCGHSHIDTLENHQAMTLFLSSVPKKTTRKEKQALGSIRTLESDSLGLNSNIPFTGCVTLGKLLTKKFFLLFSHW